MASISICETPFPVISFASVCRRILARDRCETQIARWTDVASRTSRRTKQLTQEREAICLSREEPLAQSPFGAVTKAPLTCVLPGFARPEPILHAASSFVIMVRDRWMGRPRSSSIVIRTPEESIHTSSNKTPSPPRLLSSLLFCALSLSRFTDTSVSPACLLVTALPTCGYRTGQKPLG